MGILTKEVEVKPSGKMIQYYKDKGYNAKYREPLMVKVEDLPYDSHYKVSVVCDVCGESTIIITYGSFNRAIERTGHCICKKCTYEKVKQTNLRLYGVDNYAKTKECHEKMKTTMQLKYGVDHNSKLPDYREKFHNTCVDRYGENYMQIFRQKAENTFYEDTGYYNPFQSPKIREKIKQTFIEKYGVDNPNKSTEVREKTAQTLYLQSSQKSSIQQRYINNLYKGILNYPIKYYNVDIFLPNDNLTVEYDGGFHMGNVITGRESSEEYIQKEIIRNNVIKREGYKQMRIISSKDKLPSDEILLQMLEQTKQYFSNYPNHSWIEFNVDASTVRNAEQKDGVFFNYGELRKIKKSDLPNENENTVNTEEICA